MVTYLIDDEEDILIPTRAGGMRSGRDQYERPKEGPHRHLLLLTAGGLEDRRALLSLLLRPLVLLR
jgi:hypothetical protein